VPNKTFTFDRRFVGATGEDETAGPREGTGRRKRRDEIERKTDQTAFS